MIKVVVVEDSAVVREFLTHILQSDPDIAVVGIAKDGEEGVEVVKQKKPDVVTMDIHMPKVNGYDATRKIMEVRPTPIVIVSGSSTAEEVSTTFHAIEAGALAVVRRPAGVGHPSHDSTTRELIQAVKLMSEVKVIRRWPRYHQKGRTVHAPASPQVEVQTAPSEIKLIAVGASTGGPIVLQTILSRLPKNFPVPLVIVQHVAQGFVEGFAEWLSAASGFPVKVAADNELAVSGKAYIAPDNVHIGVNPAGRIELAKGKPEHGLCPSVSYLFRSVADSFGSQAVGVLLTGMGKDGAEELKNLSGSGAVTIVQDEESSIVYGMPGEAVRLGAATYVLPPEKIAEALKLLVEKKS